MGQQQKATLTRPWESADTEMVSALSNALISVLDALAAMHGQRPGPWLDQIEQSIVREAASSDAQGDGIRALQAIVQRVRVRLLAEALEL